jgi:hypothetical protein
MGFPISGLSSSDAGRLSINDSIEVRPVSQKQASTLVYKDVAVATKDGPKDKNFDSKNSSMFEEYQMGLVANFVTPQSKNQKNRMFKPHNF